MARSGRLVELVQLLAGRRARTVEEIAERFEISARTAYRDLAELDSHHIPLVRDERGYRLLEGATLRPLNLDAEERALLKVALHNPALARHRPLSRALRRLEEKLDAVAAAVEETPSGLQLAGLDRSGAAAGEALDALRRAAAESQEAEILYASLSGGTRRWRGLDPYRVFHRAGAWYVAGRCHLHDAPRIFRLDRIAGVRTLGVHFEAPRDFDLDRFLAGAWDVFRGEGDHAVVLTFDAAMAPLIENATHHAGEEVSRLPDGRLEYRVRLSHLDEIARWIVGFGGRARVESPPELAARVTELAQGALAAQGVGKGRRSGTD